MTVEIKHNGEIQEIIEAKNAYVFGLNLSNYAEQNQTLNIDELQFDGSYVALKRVLPNGKHIELLIIKTDEETIEKYKGLTTLSLDFNDVTIVATI